ncbi:MAG: divalent cation tolerance protein CutA [Bacteroidales bacterium]|nr:divalent cation tolerance protein CutA [Bacteroidales bacterium]
MVLIYVIVENSVDAMRVAKKVLEERLAHNIRVLPETWSFKRVQDQIMDERESVIMIETKSSNYAEIESQILRMLAPKKPAIYSVPMIQLNQDLFNVIQSQAVAV